MTVTFCNKPTRAMLAAISGIEPPSVLRLEAEPPVGAGEAMPWTATERLSDLPRA